MNGRLTTTWRSQLDGLERYGKPKGGDVRFVPLAMSEMGEHGTCVAGMDIDKKMWIRPVIVGASCLFEKQAAKFELNHIHELRIGARPLVNGELTSFHTEDRAYHAVSRLSETLSASGKLELLRSTADKDLGASLLAGGRSLFIVEPQDMTFRIDEYGKPRVGIAGFPDSPISEVALDDKGIGISRSGIPCTCPFWNSFSSQTWPGKSISLSMINHHTAGASVFLAISLGRLYDGKHWLMVAGVHIVGDDRIWL